MSDDKKPTTGPTPGPWTLLAENEMTIVVASAEPRIDGKAFGIAIIPHHEGANRISWATKEANARLIESAPDFLAACTPGRLSSLAYILHRYDALNIRLGGRESKTDKEARAAAEDLLTALRAAVARVSGRAEEAER